MPVKNFSLKGNMNKNVFKGRQSLDNFGMSPIIIVLVVLVVFILGGVGFGFYVYNTNPFLRVYDSASKFENVKEVNSYESKGSISFDFNLGKLLKKYDLDRAFETPESNELIASLDRDSTISYSVDLKLNTSEDKFLVGSVISSKNLNFSNELNDMLDNNGTVLDFEAFVEGSSKLDNDQPADKFFVRINKLPNYLPIPTGQGFAKINLSSLTGSWFDITEEIAKELSISDDNKKQTNKPAAENTMIKTNNIYTCEKKTLSLFDKLQLARLGTSSDLFSKSVNKGTVDLDGIKATQLDFEIDLSKKSTIIKSMDEMSKIVCKDASEMENDKLVDYFANDLALNKINSTYYIDNNTGLPTKYLMELVFDEKKFDSKLNIRLDFSIKNINNTKVEAPTNVKSYQKYVEENISQLEKEFSKITGAGSTTTSTGGTAANAAQCPLTPKTLAEVTAACNSSSQTAGFRDRSGYCNCYWNQYQLSACNDDEGRYQRVYANCSRFLN